MAGRESIPYLKFDVGQDTPTIQDEMRGQIRIFPWSTGGQDRLFLAAKRKDGTIGYVSLSGMSIQNADAATLTAMSTLDFSSEFVVAETPDYEANIGIKAPLSMTIGPLYVNDIPATATSPMVPGYFDGAATVVLGGSAEFKAPADGWITGMILNARNSRTAGTATAAARIGGVTTTFASGACQLNGTDLLRASAVTTIADGVPFVAGDRIGIDLVTSGWAPTTTDAMAWFTIQMKPT